MGVKRWCQEKGPSQKCLRELQKPGNQEKTLDLYGRTLVILESESRDGGGSGWRDAEELEAVDVSHRVQGVLLAESEGWEYREGKKDSEE